MAKDKKSGDRDSGIPKPFILPPPAPGPEPEEIDEIEEDLESSGPSGKAPGKPEPGKPPAGPSGSKDMPPLFVKVDKYEDVIKNVQELRSYTLSLRDALDALADIEKELKVGMEVAHKTLDRVNAIISMLDSKLLRTQGIDIEGEVKTPKEVEGYIKNVYGQIERLKSELKAIS